MAVYVLFWSVIALSANSFLKPDGLQVVCIMRHHLGATEWAISGVSDTTEELHVLDSNW